VRRVRIQNFKGIAACDVPLRPLNVLVGRNGSGKSNFLETLVFLGSSLAHSPDDALQVLGGVESVFHRGADGGRGPGIRLWMLLPDGSEADYGFELGSARHAVFVRRERVLIRRGDQRIAHFDIQRSSPRRSDIAASLSFRASRESMPPPRSDQLYLDAATSFPEFRPIFDSLLMLGFYDPEPGEMRKLKQITTGQQLSSDAQNIAAVVGNLEETAPEVMRRVEQYLQTIVPHITGVRRVTYDAWETLQFKQARRDAGAPWTFNSLSMSDGTLRALAILVALQGRGDGTPHFAGIEEPETALHPAAIAALLDALREASAHTQVVLTTHSADLLDRLDLDHEHLLVAQSTGETAQIAAADPASRDAIRRHLFGAGELLRMDQLEVDPATPATFVDLFDGADS
jgi:predicted ATPase